MVIREVDHDKRRQKIAEVAVNIIGNEGLEAATVRGIASKAGYSTTVITHYFKNKDELLLLAYKHIAIQAWQRIEDVIANSPDDILGALMTMTAMDKHVHHSWRVYIAIWQKAAHNPVLARELDIWFNKALAQVNDVIRARIGDHSPLQKKAPRIARHLVALVQGTAIQYLFDDSSWSAKEVKETLSREIEFLLDKL